MKPLPETALPFVTCSSAINKSFKNRPRPSCGFRSGQQHWPTVLQQQQSGLPFSQLFMPVTNNDTQFPGRGNPCADKRCCLLIKLIKLYVACGWHFHWLATDHIWTGRISFVRTSTLSQLIRPAKVGVLIITVVVIIIIIIIKPKASANWIISLGAECGWCLTWLLIECLTDGLTDWLIRFRRSSLGQLIWWVCPCSKMAQLAGYTLLY